MNNKIESILVSYRHSTTLFLSRWTLAFLRFFLKSAFRKGHQLVNGKGKKNEILIDRWFYEHRPFL